MPRLWVMPWNQEFLYGTAFVKNSYVGRTFIKPKQSSRESSVAGKAECTERGRKRKAGDHDR